MVFLKEKKENINILCKDEDNYDKVKEIIKTDKLFSCYETKKAVPKIKLVGMEKGSFDDNDEEPI